MPPIIRNVLPTVKTKRIIFYETFRIMEPWQRLTQARERAGYENAVDAANAYGWTKSTYISHENGTRGLRPDVARRYAKAFRVKAEWLLYGDSPGERTKSRPDKRDTIVVPLLSMVSAGKLSEAVIDDADDTIAVSGLGKGDFLALRVVGDSMNRVSPEGSVIIVDRGVKDLVSGRYYVFSHRGEATYKIYRSGDPAYLEPYSTNPENRPIFVKGKRDLHIVGRVRRTILDL